MPCYFATRARDGITTCPEAGDSDSGPEEGAEEPESTSDGRGIVTAPPLRWRS